MPDKRSGPPGEGSRPQDPPSPNGQVTLTVARPADIGCPCGCVTRLPWLDDEDCVRHLPLPEARDWPVYDRRMLGLEAHDRTLCASCQAVGS